MPLDAAWVALGAFVLLFSYAFTAGRAGWTVRDPPFWIFLAFQVSGALMLAGGAAG